MKKIFFLVLWSLLCIGVTGSRAESEALSENSFARRIIPTPRSVEGREGSFILGREVAISAPTRLMHIVDYLMEYMPLSYVGDRPLKAGVIRLDVEPSMGREEYVLDVKQERIDIVGGSADGVFYAIQSLFQLLPSEVYTRHAVLPFVVECCKVEDSPRFDYRASHLDVARTWSPVERLLRHIDLMAYHKLNTLHLHLTDDEGWRIEIKSHPELALEGGFRGEGSPIMAVYGKWGERYGGYYTQEELSQIVEYAARRSITVIPEIDLPGHSRTVARLHPEILCDYTPSLSSSAGYDFRSAWCPSREENYRLLEDIIDEVCEIFPSEYIHIGGDEVELSQWRRCPRCSAFMQSHSLTDYHQLQEYFMTRVADMLRWRGKRPVVWNEAINGGSLGKDALVQGWENVKACHKSTSEGYKTVVMPGQWFYFDMRQSKHEWGHTWAAIFDAEKVYDFSLESNGFTPSMIENVVGFESTFFSEAYVGHNPETTDYLDFMLYPRTVAFAELAWHYDDKNWREFKSRLTRDHYDRLSAMGIAFRLFPPRLSYQSGVLTASVDDNSELYYLKYGSPEEHLYTSPISTSEPQLYLFRSRYRHALSPLVAHSSFYRRLKPSLRLTTSLPSSDKAPLSRVADYSGAGWTTRTHLEGDWLLYEFDKPLTCNEIYLQTGYLHLPRLIITSADVYLSTDGRNFTPYGSLYGGSITIRPTAPIKSIKLKVTSSANGENRVVLQPLVIK